MTKVTVAGLSILGALAVALVLGTMYLDGDPNSTNVVTVLGLLGLGISQLLGNKSAEDARANSEVAKNEAEELNANLKNGTFKRLLREALVDLSRDDSFQPLEIHKEGREDKQDG